MFGALVEEYGQRPVSAASETTLPQFAQSGRSCAPKQRAFRVSFIRRGPPTRFCISSNRGKRRQALIRPPLKDFHFAIPQGWGVVLAEKVPFYGRESDAPNCISPLGTGSG